MNLESNMKRYFNFLLLLNIQCIMSAVKIKSGFIILRDGAKVWYEQIGTGSDKTLLCLPLAFGSCQDSYPNMLDKWSKEFNVVTFDPRGYVRSQATKRNFSPKMFFQDAIDATEVMKKLGFDKYYVFGTSDGGTIGLILAGKYPEHVEKLVAVAANSFVSRDDINLDDAVQKHHIVDKLPSMIKQYGKKRLPALIGEYMKNERAIFRAGGDICVSEVVAIKCPTLIIQGDRDKVVAAIHPYFLHKVIPNSLLHIVPNVGHSGPYFSSGAFYKLTTDFLNENSTDEEN